MENLFIELRHNLFIASIPAIFPRIALSLDRGFEFIDPRKCRSLFRPATGNMACIVEELDRG
jgi:hypothetical protein